MARDEVADKLERGRKTARLNPELQVVLARLKKGQLWIVETWIALQDVDDWGDRGEEFWQSFDEWDRLEHETREKWKFESCVIGGNGCHKDAPINCDYCAGRVGAFMAMPFKAMVCDRGTGRLPKVVSQGQSQQAEQTTLFDTGRAH